MVMGDRDALLESSGSTGDAGYLQIAWSWAVVDDREGDDQRE